MGVLNIVGGVGAVALLFVAYGMSIRGTRAGAGCASCGTIRARVAVAGLPPSTDDVGKEIQGLERETGDDMEIRIFGPGCWRCHELEARTREALSALGRDASLAMVDDIMEIADAGALRTPAMQVNGRFVLQGRVPGVRELMSIIGKAFDTEPAPAHPTNPR